MPQPAVALKCVIATREPLARELDLEAAMTRTFFTALASAVLILALGLGPALAKHDDDDDHDNGRHLGWYKHHKPDPVYAYPAPVVVYPAPPPVVVYPPPAPVWVVPPPVYEPPSVNFVFPLHLK
jgi:hypothetical protein